MTNSVPSRGLEWTNLILGGSLFCAAFMFGELPAAALNAAIVGLLIVSCSTFALYSFKPWTEWSNIGLGSWAILAPYMLGFGLQPTPLTIHVLIGLSVAAIAALQLFTGRNQTLAEAKLPNRK